MKEKFVHSRKRHITVMVLLVTAYLAVILLFVLYVRAEQRAQSYQNLAGLLLRQCGVVKQ